MINIHTELTPTGTLARLSGSMTVCNAAQLEGSLSELARRHRRLEVCLAEVSEIDEAGIYVLVRANLLAKQRGSAFVVLSFHPRHREMLTPHGIRVEIDDFDCCPRLCRPV